MSKKEKRTTPVDLPKEYRVVVMHFAKHKSYRVYCKKYGTKKGEEIISLLHDLISSRLQNQEFVFWLDPDTALLTLEKERYRSVCEELELSFSERIIPFYLPEDLERGYIKAEYNVNGRCRFKSTRILHCRACDEEWSSVDLHFVGVSAHY